MFPPDVINRLNEIVLDCEDRLAEIETRNRRHLDKPPSDPEVHRVIHSGREARVHAARRPRWHEAQRDGLP